jgi:Concanavalin A-like lectin/glucanases superfamily
MTPVIFHFVTPDGLPLANAQVDIQLTGAAFELIADGVQMPRLVQAMTDDTGHVTVPLLPSETYYYVSVMDPLSDVGLRYKILVPHLDIPVRFQDIVIVGEMSNETYDAGAIQIIHDAKAYVMAHSLAAVQAAATVTNAATDMSAYVTAASNQATAAAASAAAALASQGLATTGINTAVDSAAIATTKAAEAASSAAAVASQVAGVTAAVTTATTSAAAATAQASIATDQAVLATTGAVDAITAMTSAATAATTATTQATVATTQAGNAATAASVATTAATTATTQATGAAGSASTATTAATSASTQAGIATAQASDALTSANAAAVSATLATTKAATATTQATAAQSSATAAAASAASIGNSATTVATAADAATTQANNAASSASSAATSAASAASSANAATSGGVRFDVAQTLTLAEQAQARANIAAPDQTSVSGNAGTATALSAGADRTKLDSIAVGATANSTDAVLLARANHTGTQSVATITGLAPVATSGSKADVGLGNVDNTSDTNKPVSTAMATALALKADQATTYSKTETDSRIQAVVGAAPLALDTLQEIAAQLAADESAVSALTTSVSQKAPLTHVGATGSAHGVATTSVNGFMAAADKIKLDSITGTNTGDQTLASLGAQAALVSGTTIKTLGGASILGSGDIVVGVANGLAKLDSTTHIPLAQVPMAVSGALRYQGTWNAGTNTPALTDGTGSIGDFYSVSVASNGSADASYANVSLLLHADGTNGSTVFTDSSTNPHNVANMGGAQVSTAVSKFGGGALALDGTSKYLSFPSSTDFDFGTGDFTMELWAYPTSVTGVQMLIGRQEPGSGMALQLICVNGLFYFTVRSLGGGALAYASGGAPILNTWSHIAAVRSGTNLYLFQDGALVGTGSASVNLTCQRPLTIGALDDTSITAYYPGYLDEVRITKGVARYTGAFIAPTAPFPNSASSTGTWAVGDRVGYDGAAWFKLSGNPVGVTSFNGRSGVVAFTSTDLPAFTGDVTSTAGSSALTLVNKNANGLNSATTVVNVANATAPTIGQALIATSATTATWQTLTLASLGGQASLVSGTNIKTIGGVSILGSGDITVSGGSRGAFKAF